MKRYIALLTLCLLFQMPSESIAQFRLGIQGGYNLDAFTEDGVEEGAFQLGGQAQFGLANLPLVINPSVDYFFNGIDDVNVLQFNVDALFTFGVDNTLFTPYAGAGLGITRVALKADIPLLGNLVEAEETNYGLNVLGGAIFGEGPVQPYVQARVTIGDHLAFINENGEKGAGYALIAGLLFKVGQ